MIIIGVYLVIRSAVYFSIILRRALQFPLEESRHALCSLFNQCSCLLASFYPSPMCASRHQTFRPSANWNRECEQLMYVETTLCVLASYQRVVSNCNASEISNMPRVGGVSSAVGPKTRLEWRMILGKIEIARQSRRYNKLLIL